MFCEAFCFFPDDGRWHKCSRGPSARATRDAKKWLCVLDRTCDLMGSDRGSLLGSFLAPAKVRDQPLRLAIVQVCACSSTKTKKRTLLPTQPNQRPWGLYSQIAAEKSEVALTAR